MADPYVVGQTRQFPVEFTNAAVPPVATDPATVTFRYRKPGDTATTELIYGTDAEVQKDSTGNYHVALDLDVEGVWRYRWESTGNPHTATEDITFWVRGTEL